MWIPLAAAIIWLVVRLLKSDTKLPTIPARWRPVLAIALGAAAGVLDAVAGGTPWRDAAAHGLSAGVLAILANVFGVDVLRAGREVPLPAAISVRPPPPPGGGALYRAPGAPRVPEDTPTSPYPLERRRVTLQSPAAMAVVAAIFPATVGGLFVVDACTPAQMQAVKSAEHAADAACSIVQAFGAGGKVSQVCATEQEIAAIVTDVTALRATAIDAGVGHLYLSAPGCRLIPTTNVCATDGELSHALALVVAHRADGGAE